MSSGYMYGCAHITSIIIGAVYDVTVAILLWLSSCVIVGVAGVFYFVDIGMTVVVDYIISYDEGTVLIVVMLPVAWVLSVVALVLHCLMLMLLIVCMLFVVYAVLSLVMPVIVIS